MRLSPLQWPKATKAESRGGRGRCGASGSESLSIEINLDSSGLYPCLYHTLPFLLVPGYITYRTSFSPLTQVSIFFLCFDSFFNSLLFFYFPRLANYITKQSKSRVPCPNSLFLGYEEENWLPEKTLTAAWLSKVVVPAQQGWKVGKERGKGGCAGNIPHSISGGLRSIMSFLFCFWPRTYNIFLSLGAFPWYYWDPSVAKYLVMKIKKKWWKDHSSAQVSKGLL